VAGLGGEITSTLSDGREVRVRSARARDARPLCALIDDVAAETEVTLLVLPGQLGARTWRRRIADSAADPRSLLLTAVVGGELVGNLGLRPDPHPCSPHVAWIGMSVAAPWRGLGVGCALMDVAADWAAANGVDKLALSVFPHNARALRFYERQGFEREGLRRAHLRRAGEYHDEVLMARFLTSPR
jgi:L-phenylalanine/L-methionine N-acetyltransferase